MANSGSEPEQELKILICIPVRGKRNRYVVPDSSQSKCFDCGRMVFVAPSGVRLQQSSSNCIAVCTKCGLARLKKQKEPKFEMVPGQDKEILAWRLRQ